MPQAPSLAPSLLVAALTMLAPAQAQEVSSLYTPLDLKKCKDVTPADAKEYGTIWRCEGYEGLSVRVAEGDLWDLCLVRAKHHLADGSAAQTC